MQLQKNPNLRNKVCEIFNVPNQLKVAIYPGQNWRYYTFFNATIAFCTPRSIQFAAHKSSMCPTFAESIPSDGGASNQTKVGRNNGENLPPHPTGRFMNCNFPLQLAKKKPRRTQWRALGAREFYPRRPTRSVEKFGTLIDYKVN
ncbi:hypothetical protein NQ318_013189 [Aromia moschata]|uniref:Uncharacterized protein n=1 Tax=Aromia moschata TaxID=1265417 RepID=A0AAV8XQK9_9CUCU|nr:hypothetical protein NQ318_013189 [Aromia moschata]